jgi:pimeloyl-ACP methyl ester carboxylesterase
MPGVAVTAPTGGRVVNRYVPVGDWSVHLRVGRPGDVGTALDPVPIVFVHGYVQASRSWLPTLKELARRHLVIAPDLPGFGWSQSAQAPLDVPGQAVALAAIMDAAGIGRAVLVGSAFGAQVVAQLAADHPDRALGIVLVAPTFDPEERSLPRQVVRAVGGLLREWPSVWLEHLRDLVLAGPSRIVTSFRLGWAHRIETELPEVHAPAVVVRGSQDPLASRRWVRALAALMPDARALEIGGAGRALGQSAPEALARIVDEHVAAVTAAPAPTAAAARD